MTASASEFSKPEGGLANDFLELLQGRAQWKALANKDEFGNDTYAAEITIPIYLRPASQSYGGTDSQSAKDDRQEGTIAFITDFYNIRLGDRITINGLSYQVQGATISHNEFAEPLYQSVDISSTRRG